MVRLSPDFSSETTLLGLDVILATFWWANTYYTKNNSVFMLNWVIAMVGYHQTVCVFTLATVFSYIFSTLIWCECSPTIGQHRSSVIRSSSFSFWCSYRQISPATLPTWAGPLTLSYRWWTSQIFLYGFISSYYILLWWDVASHICSCLWCGCWQYRVVNVSLFINLGLTRNNAG